MNLDADICFRAARARDRRFDGHFFVAITSTRIYCRPICPARPASARTCVSIPAPRCGRRGISALPALPAGTGSRARLRGCGEPAGRAAMRESRARAVECARRRSCRFVGSQRPPSAAGQEANSASRRSNWPRPAAAAGQAPAGDTRLSQAEIAFASGFGQRAQIQCPVQVPVTV